MSDMSPTSLAVLTALTLTVGPWASASVLAAAGPPAAGRGLATLVVQVSESIYGTSRFTEANTYDTRGNLLVVVREYHFHYGNITSESRDTTTNTYNHRNDLDRSVREIDFNGDGTADGYETISNTYDHTGNLLRSITTAGSYRTTITNTYDVEGNLLMALYESDFDGDGVVDAHNLVTHTYGLHGERLLSIYQGGTSAYTYDARGLVLTIVENADFENDGTVEIHSTYTNTYDPQGNRLTNLLETDYNTNGTIDHYRELTTNTYDARRNVLTTIIEYDYAGDGTIEYGRTESNTYDAHGNVLRLVVDSADGDGIVTDHQLWTFSYDVTGNRTRAVFEEDWDADGVVDQTSTISYSY